MDDAYVLYATTLTNCKLWYVDKYEFTGVKKNAKIFKSRGECKKIQDKLMEYDLDIESAF